MNIGIVTTWFERGASYVSLQYKEMLEAAGHKVFIYARGGGDARKGSGKWIDGVDVTWGKKCSFPVGTYMELRDFGSWLKDKRIETVFFNEQRWLKPVALCRKMKIKTGAYVDYYTESSIRLFSIYDFLICNTRRHYGAFKWHKQAYYVPWGTDTNLYDAARLRVRTDKVRFFTSAGMNPHRKGTDLLLKAFQAASKSELFRAKAELVIHTQVSLSGLLKSCDEGVGELSVKTLIQKNVIRIIQETVSAPGLYHLGDIYVYPSRLDGVGLTVAEALSCAMPVVVPNDAPMNEFVPAAEGAAQLVDIEKFFAREDGYYWPQNEVSVDKLADALVFYIENAAQINAYSEAARSHALTNLDWRKNAVAVAPIFENTQFMDVDSDIVIQAIKQYSAKYPLIDQVELFYRFLFAIRPIIKRLVAS